MSFLKNIVYRMKGLQEGTGIKIYLLLLLLIIFTGCVEPYETEFDEKTDLISIEGSIIKGENVQSLLISKTTSLVYPQFEPVRKCDVRLIDDLDNEYVYKESFDGKYSISIPDEELVFGRKYKIKITTSMGDIYESAYEELNSGVEVDTVYYRIEEKIENTSGELSTGLQFYIDLKAADTISRYYRWKLEETYEYNSEAPISYYFLDASLDPIEPNNSYDLYTCWKTDNIPYLFLSSTVNLVLNEKKQIPLNYVSTISDRLKIKYSILVKQYTLNEGAYDYWQKKKITTQESGGLYTQQPGQPVTNIKNVNDSSEQVLGYFWVSQLSRERIIVPRIPELEVIGSHCELVEFDIVEHGEGPFPRYIWEDPLRDLILTGTPTCFICTLKGGTTNRPAYWDQ